MSDSTPVAVVIPLYNGEDWIREALDSVLSQDLAPAEIVVVDDGSTDSSPDLVRAYAGVSLLASEGNGASAARNLGLTRSASPLVAFLDQDDVWHASHLRLLVDALDSNPVANTAVGSSVCFARGTPRFDPGRSGSEPFDPWAEYPFTVGFDGPSLTLVRREALVRSGAWQECATGMGYELLFLKLAVLHTPVRLRARTVGKRIHASQQWLQVEKFGVSYLEDRHAVMQCALRFRRDHRPNDPELPHHARRLRALVTARELAAACLSEDRQAVPDIARRLERDLDGESQGYLAHAFGCLTDSLFKTYDAQELRRGCARVLGELLDLWPADATSTGSAMRQLIGAPPRVH